MRRTKIATDAEGRPALLLAAAQRTGAVALELCGDEGNMAKSMVVDRAWIQSRLTSTARQDRAVFQLTDRPKADRNRDAGRRRRADRRAGRWPSGRAAIARREPAFIAAGRSSWPPAGGDRAALSFCRAAAAAGRDAAGISAAVPRGLDAADVLATDPAGQRASAVAIPTASRGSIVWQWSGWFWFWGRHPLLDQAELESWAEAAPRDALPDRVNVYLFSSLGKVEQAEVRTAGRTWIVLWASGAALVAGLLLIYLPVSRHPAMLLGVGVALLAAGLIAPEPTLLLAQAACLGLVLTLLAGLLERGAARRRALAGGEPPSSRVEIGSTHSRFMAAAADKPPSTAAIAAISPQPLGDSEP